MYNILVLFFFFNDTATTEIYTLSLHDALPIFKVANYCTKSVKRSTQQLTHELEAALKEVNQEKLSSDALPVLTSRSEEHTSELQSRQYLVCRLLLEKKKPPHSPPNLPSTPLSSSNASY